MAHGMDKTDELAKVFSGVKISTDSKGQNLDDYLNAIVGTPGLVDKLVSSVACQKFDPLITRRELLLKESDPLKLCKDISILIAVFLQHGASFLEKRNYTPELTKISPLVNKYNIKRYAATNDNKCITLSRIMNSFPEMVFEYRKNSSNLKTPVMPDDMKKVGIINYPKEMCGEFFFYLIPMKPNFVGDEDTKEGLIKGLLIYLVLEYKALNGRKAKRLTDNYKILEHIMKHALASFNSSLVSEAKRKGIVANLGLRSSTRKAWTLQFNKCFSRKINVHKLFNVA